MTTSEILNLILPTLLTAVIIPLLIGVGNAIKKKYQLEVNQKYLEAAVDSVTTAVAEVMQTFVTTMKKQGEWNTENAKKAAEMARLRAIEIMGVAVLQAMPAIVTDFEAWLTAKIEAATLAQKAVTPA